MALNPIQLERTSESHCVCIHLSLSQKLQMHQVLKSVQVI